MRLSSQLGRQPREIAEQLQAELETGLGPLARRVEVAGPGFLNLFLGDRWHRDAVARILGAERFGAREPRYPGVLLEFVSANPTGPLTAAGGRGAAYGDSLARVLEVGGREVSREYYLNDAGTQIRLFAASIAARMQGADPPDGGYSGDYVAELAEELRAAGADPADLDDLARRGAEAMRQRIEATLERFRVHFDTWSSERELLERRALELTLEQLAAAGHTYEAEGALWLRSTDFGDDKDRVLVRSDGEPTYFGGDIAYHRDKLERDGRADRRPARRRPPRLRAADEGRLRGPRRRPGPVRGADHAARQHRRGRRARPDVEAKRRVRDARRADRRHRSGRRAILPDAALKRHRARPRPRARPKPSPRTTPSTTSNTRTRRIASILRKAAAEGGAEPRGRDRRRRERGRRRSGARCEPAERELVRRLLELPGEVEQAAAKRAPHRLTAYAMAVAADFHAFYRDCRVVGADAEAGVDGLEAARLGV